MLFLSLKVYGNKRETSHRNSLKKTTPCKETFTKGGFFSLRLTSTPRKKGDRLKVPGLIKDGYNWSSYYWFLVNPGL